MRSFVLAAALVAALVPSFARANDYAVCQNATTLAGIDACTRLLHSTHSRAQKSAILEIRGVGYIRLGIYDSALADLNAALKWSQPSRVEEVHYFRSMALAAVGRYEEAALDASSALIREHDIARRAVIVEQRGIYYLKAGNNPQQAVADLSAAFEYYAQRHDAQRATHVSLNLGLAYATEGEYKAAVHYTGVAAILGSLDAKFVLAMLYRKLGDEHSAAENYAAAAERFGQLNNGSKPPAEVQELEWFIKQPVIPAIPVPGVKISER